ncbi:MAG: flavin reductase family protein, partial [Firmicutes bacterium]|nr:flavin reductase family protein [Bacillota bacterium]
NTHRLIKESGCFAVNVLRVDQKDLARFFSSSKKDKFAVMPYKEEKSGAPILKEAYAYLDCKVWKEVECGDYTMFIGEVLKGSVDKEGETLTTRDLESTYVG